MTRKLILALSFLSIGCMVSAQKIGGKVRILDDGTWMSGKLISIKNGQYFVHFDIRPDSYDKWVKENEIVFVDGDDRQPIFKTEYRDRIKHDTVYITQIRRDTVYINSGPNNNNNYNNNNNNNNNRDRDGDRNRNFFRVGDNVDAQWGAEWYPARITDMRDGRYKISYDGYSNVWDEWVSGDKIRRR